MRSLLIALGLLAPHTAAQRDILSFDFGWEHRTGLTEWAPPDAPAPERPDPGLQPPEAQPGYNTTGWQAVQLPHDGLIGAAPSAAACPDGCSGKSFIPRHVLWYRKSFRLPATWAGSAVWLDFAGSFRNTTVWVNGVLAANHVCGYTPFRLRLDNITAVRFGAGGRDNEIAVFVDPDNGEDGARDHGSGWWYEGGGLYRHVDLVRASTAAHVEQDGLFAYSNLTDAKAATVHAKAAVVAGGHGGPGAAWTVCVSFNLTGPDGKAAAVAPDAGTTLVIAPGATATATSALAVSGVPLLWSSATPHLYTVAATVSAGACGGGAAGGVGGGGAALDSVSAVHGIRHLRYDADAGFALNGEHFKVRGFCDHNNFGVVGMAVPERINLFRAQASRAIGGNGRRTSHNPPDSSMLDIYDRIGVVVMDENRLFANDSAYVDNMGALVKRDRNHPSVVIWSFCNEGGCEGTHEAGGPAFQAIAAEYDGSRPTLANMFTFGDLLSNTIDVQGFSHQSRTKLDACHAALPTKPIYLSECCSCNTMRDEDVGCETVSDNPHKICTQTSFNARCAESNKATNASDGVGYAVGTMVWTLFDYYGEPPVGGPEVSSTYGQFDLVGFPKAAAFWYRTQWLLTVADGPDKTFPTRGADEVHLVESWESPDAFPQTRGNTTRAVHAYTSAAAIELLVNNVSQGVRPVQPMAKGPGSYAEWTAVPWEAGELTAIARDGAGRAVATDRRHTNGTPARLKLSLDAPSALTGTGSALLLDGHDAALVRCSILDGNGNVVHLATDNVTFAVVSGPGRVQGTGNGDPHSQLSNADPTHPAYHGLVRAVVRVTSTAARGARERALLATIDARGPMASLATSGGAADPIVVEVRAPGFPLERLTIPTSLDAAADGVYAIAEAAAGKPVDFFGHSQKQR